MKRILKRLVVLLLCTNSLIAQFSYQYKTSFVCNGISERPISQLIESYAEKINEHLNYSIFFDRSFLKDAQEVREYHCRPKARREFIGQLYDVVTADGKHIGATFFDRGSDTLLVVAEGFTNAREVMSPFVAMFPQYDVVLFDFRGHGYQPGYWSDYVPCPSNVTKWFFGVDPDDVRFGCDEDKDVRAVVDAFKDLKKSTTGKRYANINGLGVCYGAFILLKTLSLNPGLFDRLVLDGCWLSLSLYIEKIERDLKIMCNPQEGGWSDHWFFSHEYTKQSIDYIAKNFLFTINDISLLDYVDRLGAEQILFFYGKDDYTITRDEFEQLWRALPAHVRKTAIITSNPHVRNHLRQKELYKCVCDIFFSPFSHIELEFCLNNPQTFLEFFSNKLMRDCAPSVNQ